MLLYVIADFFRRRKPRRADDDWPAAPLLLMLIFWILFGLGALVGALAIVAALTDRWTICSVAGVLSAVCLVGAVMTWMRLNRLD